MSRLREGASLESREGGEGRIVDRVLGDSRMGEVEVEAAVGLTPRVSSGDMYWSLTAFSSPFSPRGARPTSLDETRGADGAVLDEMEDLDLDLDLTFLL